MIKNVKLWICALLMVANSSLAQTDQGPPPPPPASIDNQIVFALFLAICIAFILFNHKQKHQNNLDNNL